MNARSLELSREEMREFGYRIIDLLVEHIAGLGSAPVGRKGEPASLIPQFRGGPPELPGDFIAAVDRVRDEVLSSTLHVDHPRFFGFVPAPGNFVSAMADTIASGFNVFNGSWMAGSGPAAVELAVVEWFRRFCGLSEEAGGIFVSGGSVANMTALAVARHTMLGEDFAKAVVYFSDQTHSSVDRALRILGFRTDQIRRIGSDENFQLCLDDVETAIRHDRREGRQPFCLVVNAGTTNTGAVDPMRKLAGLARGEGLWIHADGAYGAAAAITDRGRRELDGLSEMDSLSLDPHKWLFQPFECGCVLLRDAKLLRSAFQILPDYLQDLRRGFAEVNPCDYGIQLTRGFRALKVWLSFQVFGAEAFRSAVERGFTLAEYAEMRIRRMERWEILSPARMAIVGFRFVPQRADPERLQLGIVDAMLRDGVALATSTVLRGKTALRLCTINPRTTEQDIDRTLTYLDGVGRELDRE